MLQGNLYAQGNKSELPKSSQQVFIENKGQWDSEVLFLTKQNGMNAWITKHGVVYDFYKIHKGKNGNAKASREARVHKESSIEGHVVKMNLENCNSELAYEKGTNAGATYNYFIGNDKNKWVSNVQAVSEVQVKECYKNIDVKYYFDEGKLRYDYIVKPNADVADIKMNIEGANATKINSAGELVFSTRYGEVKNAKLFAYQEIGGKKQKIECAFNKSADGSYGFDIGTYNKSKELIIDPLVFSTYVGGSDADGPTEMQIDLNGDIIVCGGTWSANFPVGAGIYFFNGWSDAFISKFNSNGVLIYSSIIGDVGWEEFSSLDLFSNGDIIAIGSTHSNSFPLSLPSTFGFNTDIVVAKFNGLTGSLSSVNRIYTAGNEVSSTVRISSLSQNDYYICGTTESPGFPLSLGCYDNVFVWTEGFVSKYSLTGGMVASTFFGGLSSDEIIHMDLDANDNVYFGGRTANPTFGTLYGTNNYPGVNLFSAFVGKLNSNLTTSPWCRHFGGTGNDFVESLVSHPNGNLYAIGYTEGNGLLTSSAYNGGVNDLFLMSLNMTTGVVNDAKFIGSNNSILAEWPGEIITNGTNLIFTGGIPANSSYPVTNYPLSCGDALEASITVMDPSLNSVLYSQLFGGGTNDMGVSVKEYATNDFVIAGFTFSTNLPVTNGSTHSGIQQGDLFLTRFTPNLATPVSISASQNPICLGNSSNLSATGVASYSWTPDPTLSNLNIPNPVATPISTSTYSVVGTDAFGCTHTNSITINVNSATISLATQSGSNCAPQTLVAQASPVATYTYTLQGPGGTSSTLPPTSGQATWANQAAGVYTVTASDLNGCTATSILTLTQPTATASFSCTPSTLSLVSSSNGVVTYAWAGPNAFTSNLQNPTISPISTPLNGIYTVTITDANGCTASSTVQVDVTSCICPAAPSNATYITNGSLSSVLYPGNFMPSTPIVIDGTFTVNNLLYLANNPDVYFTPNSQINVNGAAEFHVDFSHLQSCGDHMWNGINAAPNSQLGLRDNTIRDMRMGVRVNSTAVASIVGNQFTNNYISIQLLNYTGNMSSSFIAHNRFEKFNTLLPPHSSSIDNYGIRSLNSRFYRFDDNYFNNLFNGVFIFNSSAGPCLIESYANRFENVSSGNTAWAGTIGNPGGWAIWTRNTSTETKNKRLNVYGGLFPNTNQPSFYNVQNCDKGVYYDRFSGKVMGTRTVNTTAGIMVGQAANGFYLFDNNAILNCKLGISKSGDQGIVNWIAQTCTLQNNQILLNNLLSNQINGLPTAIHERYPLVNTGNSIIRGNKIEIQQPDYGIGINLEGGSKDIIEQNKIHFLFGSSNAPNTYYNTPSLIGILSNVCTAPNINYNLVDNNYSNSGSTSFAPGNNTGLFIMHSDDAVIKCNRFNYLQTAISTYGPNAGYNSGSYDLVEGNVLRGALSDILHWEFVGEGTLGNIGEWINANPVYAYNNNNFFLGSAAQSPNTNVINTYIDNVYRVTTCLTNFQDKIVTFHPSVAPLGYASLAQSMSSASNTNSNQCFVWIQNPPSFNGIHTCDPLPPSILSSNPYGDVLSEEEAQEIVQDLRYYEDFEEGADRKDRELFYNWMRANLNSQNSSQAALQAYYTALEGAPMGKLMDINYGIAALADSSAYADTLQLHNAIQALKTQNQAVATPTVFDQNEKWINHYYFMYLEATLDAIAESEWNSIATLANTCPFVGGKAVYKARLLMDTRGGPSFYNDLEICNSQGIYKNGTSKLQQQIEMLHAAQKNRVLQDNKILVYPNPFNAEITFEISKSDKEDGVLTIHDMLGNKIVEHPVLRGEQKIKVDLKHLASGVYMYRFQRGTEDVLSGKISKYD